MTAGDAQRLADRMTRHGESQPLNEQIAELQGECRLAAGLIRALLRHVSPSDVFVVHGEREGR
jgi:hypothetical protein